MIATLQDAVTALTLVVNPLSDIVFAHSVSRAPPSAPPVVAAGARRSAPSTPRGKPLGLHPINPIYPGLLSSVVEHSPCKRKVVSSILTGGSANARSFNARVYALFRPLSRPYLRPTCPPVAGR